MPERIAGPIPATARRIPKSGIERGRSQALTDSVGEADREWQLCRLWRFSRRHGVVGPTHEGIPSIPVHGGPFLEPGQLHPTDTHLFNAKC